MVARKLPGTFFHLCAGLAIAHLRATIFVVRHHANLVVGIPCLAQLVDGLLRLACVFEDTDQAFPSVN